MDNGNTLTFQSTPMQTLVDEIVSYLNENYGEQLGGIDIATIKNIMINIALQSKSIKDLLYKVLGYLRENYKKQPSYNIFEIINKIKI